MEDVGFPQLASVEAGRPEIRIDPPRPELEPLAFRLDLVGPGDVDCDLAPATPIGFRRPAIERLGEHDVIALKARRLERDLLGLDRSADRERQ